MALGGLEVLRFGKDSIEAAAQVQKSTEAIRANFGRSSGSVLTFGENAAKSFGISRQASEQFSTQIGITAKNIGLAHGQAAQMDIGLQKLAGSIGMIKGEDPTTVFHTLTLALAGNTRGLKAMGIVITPVAEKQELLREHIHKSVADLTAAQKATVIYNIATGKLGALQAEARKHSGDFADQIIILKARLTNLADDIGAKVLPVVSGLVGTISKIAAAPNFSVGVKVLFTGIEKGVKDIASGLEHALLGSTKTIKIKAPSGLILGNKEETSKGILQTIAAGLAGADWSKIGHEVGKGISSSIKFTSDGVNKIVASLVDGINANSGKIASVMANIGLVMALDLVSELLDPSFWIRNWKLIAGLAINAVLLAFAPESKFATVLKDLPIAGYFFKALEKFVGRPLLAILERVGKGIVAGLRDVFPEVSRAGEEVGAKVISPLRTLPGRALNIFEDMGRKIGQELGNAARESFRLAARIGSRVVDGLDNFIGAVGNVASRMVTRFLSPLGDLAARVTGPMRAAGRRIVNALGGFIGSVFSKGAEIGRAILEGIISGAESLAGSLVSKLKGIVSGALGKVKSAFRIGSPSKVFAEEVGRPIAEGIAKGIDVHAHKITASMVAAVNAARTAGGDLEVPKLVRAAPKVVAAIARPVAQAPKVVAAIARPVAQAPKVMVAPKVVAAMTRKVVAAMTRPVAQAPKVVAATGAPRKGAGSGSIPTPLPKGLPARTIGGVGIADWIAKSIDTHARKAAASLIGVVDVPRKGAGSGFLPKPPPKGLPGRTPGGDGRGRTEIIQLVLDGRVLAEVMHDRDQKYRRQNAGQPLLNGR